jgi:GT2 family glycosyltransferase
MRQSWGERSLDDAPFLFGSNNVFRRAALLEAGGYDESRRTNGEDTDISRKLKERGFALRYEADAICDHMRTDTVQTICRTYWRWHNSLEGRPTFAAQRRARRHARRILLRRFLRSDLAARRLELAWLDLFMYLDWAVRDWRRFLFSPRNSVRIDRVR